MKQSCADYVAVAPGGAGSGLDAVVSAVSAATATRMLRQPFLRGTYRRIGHEWTL